MNFVKVFFCIYWDYHVVFIFQFVNMVLHSLSQLSKSMPQPVTLKNLKLNGFMKTHRVRHDWSDLAAAATRLFRTNTPKKDVLFIIGDWNAKVGSQETPGVTGKFGLGMWNEAGQRLIEFCQENALVITNTLFQQHKRRLYTWTKDHIANIHWIIGKTRISRKTSTSASLTV